MFNFKIRFNEKEITLTKEQREEAEKYVNVLNDLNEKLIKAESLEVGINFYTIH